MRSERINRGRMGNLSGNRFSSLSPISYLLSPSSLPLPLKILLWFFLNLALLVAGFLLLFNAEYHFNLDWVFSAHAQQRVESMRDLLVDDLNAKPPDEWDDVLDRFDDAYHVRFALYDENGRHLLGSVDDLPSEVRARMELSPRYSRPRPTPTPRRNNARPTSPTAQTATATGDAMPVRSFIRTVQPTRYWLLVNARVDNPRAGGTMHLNVVAESPSATMGGLIIDPMPWLRLAAGAVVLSVLFWLPLLRGITRAIGNVTHAAREIAEGRLDARVHTRRRDELGVLADAINGMAARLDGLLKGQKRFLGDVAHELCAPLARLQMTLGIIEQRARRTRRGDYARTAMDKAEQIAGLVDQLLAFSRAAAGDPACGCSRWSARGGVREAAEREGAEAAVRVEVPAGLAVAADPDLLVRALGNLMRNAVRYGAGAGSDHRARGARGRGRVAVRVTDSGPGVPEEELAKIFDAFYRVDTVAHPRDRRRGAGTEHRQDVRGSVRRHGGGAQPARRRVGGGDAPGGGKDEG